MKFFSFLYAHLNPQSYAHALILMLISGCLLGISFPPNHLGIIAFIGFIPLLFSIDYLQNLSKKQQILSLYLCFFVYHGITNWWVGSWQAQSDPFLIIAGIALWLGHPFFLMIPFLAFIYIKKRIPSIYASVSLPFLVIAYEWLHSLTDLSYPWLSYGYTQIYHSYLVQIADIAGVWILSAFVIIINLLLFNLLNFPTKTIKWTISLSIIVLFLIVFGYSYNVKRVLQEKSISAPVVTISLVQPNINPWQKWSGGVFSQVEKHFQLMEMDSQNKPDVYLWSETAIPFLDVETNAHHNFSYFMNRNKNIPILSGFAEFVLIPDYQKESLAKPYPLMPGYKYYAHNAAALIQPHNSVPIHRKMKLTPFGEGFPFSQDIELLAGFLEWGVGISGWKKGKIQSPLVLRNPEGRIISYIGTVICIESIYPEFVRKYAKQGASMLAVITNDAWFDNSPGPMQHFAISQMRAIESHRCIARCGNTGISGFIHADGSIQAIAKPQSEQILKADILQMYDLTIYCLYGDYLPYISSVCSLFFLFYAGYKGKVRTDQFTHPFKETSI
ncbi:MAG: Apolipoprotein N-acyltransferase [Bacteroidota bacterium]